MLSRLETQYLQIVKGERNGAFAHLLRLLLYPLSWIYSCIIILRNRLYRYGWLKSYTPDASCIISIGNIVAGGTGKTPVTIKLAKEFLDIAPVAILSRGYRSHAEHLATPLTLSKGRGPEYPVSLCGDEPFLMAKKLPEAHLFVGKNRSEAAKMAVRAGAKLLILDDGMQHKQLARHFDIVVLDAHDPFGQGYFLPRGLLREEIISLKDAHLIILNHAETPEQFSRACTLVREQTEAPIVRVRTAISSITDIASGEEVQLKGKKVGAFCGLGNPRQFIETVKSIDADPIATHFCGDHCEISKKELAAFANECRTLGAEALVCTEKDRVKLDKNVQCCLPIVCVEIQMEITDGQCYWDSFVAGVRTKVSNIA
ncbi:MAG: tetraacyldisaccharide 4'-kinase [Chlamydiales bacterium]|nr:tetraacyldisaccharide 4'-kinase [Chlamydiia bacterium]MCP5508700.1 tetraacyldisaccharide 4'-kinase [Chlamydiales bacterium]